MKEKISGSFSMEMDQKLKDLHMNPRQLAAKIGFAYDHVRKVHRGLVFPGPRLLRMLSDQLGLDYDDMRKKVKADKAINSGMAEVFTSNDPKLLRAERFWDHLTDQDKDEMLAMIEMRAKSSLAKKSSAAPLKTKRAAR